MTTPATISTERGATMVHCPKCGHVLGEIDGGNLIVKYRARYIVMMLVNPTQQRCPNPKCGAWSEIPAQRQAA